MAGSPSHLRIPDLTRQTSAPDTVPVIDDDEAGPSSNPRLMASSFPRRHSLVGSFPRTSFAGSRNTLHLGHTEVLTRPANPTAVSERERNQAVQDERDLLVDNNIIPRSQRSSSHLRNPASKKSAGPSNVTGIRGRTGSDGRATVPSQHSGAMTSQGGYDEENGLGHFKAASPRDVTETSPLLSRNLSTSSQDSDDRIDEIWDQAVMAGKIQTSWVRETVVLASYTAPLILTFLLEYSLTVASIFAVGHIGKVELGAVSLASMTANISGYGIYQGLTTALDTLCSQAYGSGRKELVGLHMQRMIYFTWLITIPIAYAWYNGAAILRLVVPDAEVADMAGRYLRVVVLGTPGFALFESAKRFVQAQGLFHASMYVLLICAPLNGLLNYLFVWRFGFGYIGAPMAVAITNNLMPLLLFLYVYYIQGMECWNGFTTKAFRNWGPMIQLAIPGLLMLESETLAFEILTLSASWLGTTSLAAQSVLATLTSITFQFPFPLSIAGSTRIANLIGAELPVAAKLTSKVMFVAGLAFGTFNLLTLTLGRNYIPYLFTSDNEVARLVAKVLPICASFQVVDSLAAISNGILRGVGRQSFGGYVQLICYYVVALPISFLAAFPFGYGLKGTWAGVAIGLALVSLIEAIYIRKIDWRQSVKDARVRNTVA